eukprot:8103544-Pyramimonas_sp.AAC.1
MKMLKWLKKLIRRKLPLTTVSEVIRVSRTLHVKLIPRSTLIALSPETWGCLLAGGLLTAPKVWVGSLHAWPKGAVQISTYLQGKWKHPLRIWLSGGQVVTI